MHCSYLILFDWSDWSPLDVFSIWPVIDTHWLRRYWGRPQACTAHPGHAAERTNLITPPWPSSWLSFKFPYCIKILAKINEWNFKLLTQWFLFYRLYLSYVLATNLNLRFWPTPLAWQPRRYHAPGTGRQACMIMIWRHIISRWFKKAKKKHIGRIYIW